MNKTHLQVSKGANIGICGWGIGVKVTDKPSAITCKLCAKIHLEYLRGELRAERISYGELVELESLKRYIEPEDVELLEAAGVPEHA